MSTPTPESDIPGEPSLVEPARPQLPPAHSESLDTGRILRETPVVPDSSPPETLAPYGEANVSAEPEGQPSGINVLSVVALVLALVLSPLATLFGYLAVGQIRRARQKGEAIAWLAVALGWLWLVGYAVAGTVIAIIWGELS